MIIREAIANDNEELLRLTRECPMDGSIQILVDRQPDFFSLLEIKGSYKVFVAVRGNRIVGSFSLAIKDVYINHAPQRTGYLCDLKISPASRNSTVAYRLLRAMYAHMKELPIQYYLCVTARGNTQVENLLRGRAGIPPAQKVTAFRVFQFLSRRKLALSPQVVPFTPAVRDEVIRLLNRYYRDFQFASVFPDQYRVEAGTAWVALEHNKVEAFISVTDTSAYKQNVVIRVPLYLRISLPLIRCFWPHFNPPKERSTLKMLDVSYLAFAPGAGRHARSLIQFARHYAFLHGYTFLSYGVDSRNPVVKAFRSIPAITFHAAGYLFNFSAKGSWPGRRLYHDNFYQV